MQGDFTAGDLQVQEYYKCLFNRGFGSKYAKAEGASNGSDLDPGNTSFEPKQIVSFPLLVAVLSVFVLFQKFFSHIIAQFCSSLHIREQFLFTIKLFMRKSTIIISLGTMRI